MTIPPEPSTDGTQPVNETQPVPSLIDVVAARIPSRAALAAKLMTSFSDSPLHEVTVANILNGMRGLPCILWEISESDGTSVKYHGKTLLELEDTLPKWPGSAVMSPEAMLWFLYTAQIPTASEVQNFASDLFSCAELPLEAQNFCDTLANDIAPELQLIMTLTFLSRHSSISRALSMGATKDTLWKYALNDALDITVRFPMIVARIYAKIHGVAPSSLSPTSDLAHNFALQIGKDDDADFIEFTRLSWSFYMDHGPSASAHVARLCSSAWTDVYLTAASAIIAGTGPLHAKAIEDSVKYNLNMISELGKDVSEAAIAAHVGAHLAQRRIIPGYGHALLRVPDARLGLLERFLDTHPSADPKIKASLAVIRKANIVIPGILRDTVEGMRNPRPNADALSGCILHAYGIGPDFMLPFFACSRAMGFVTQYVWDKALKIPMERPLSITMDEILSKVTRDNMLSRL
ncbi:citrate synthase-like protein [Mycena filopes]|nr:citrate synthase-like protein [Mycena filopes]